MSSDRNDKLHDEPAPATPITPEATVSSPFLMVNQQQDVDAAAAQATGSSTSFQAVPQLGFGNDPEGSSETATVLPHDPFQFQNGIVPDEDLAGIRNRKKGRHVAQYQRNQNDVSAP